ncbi:DsbE family thiol:disulfide interchange protein [Vibrio nitrifigilis]|uniref:DsbE family thiol:disulfide interchange protein n=1 Tax=Vibrio nitrifigilis TaxID=2789781 RepID=A0ABS0GAW7_9VIBR|nr:DsbE family thiol:disulfide interchange protein [Vibrio nitrifigilis]MBF8999563.1 DsbE family thiol:disulfide interchange protein [Vibrio nitrifigilis]
MNKKLLFIPFIFFVVLVGFFAVQLNDNSKGDDPTKLESVLIGKPVPTFTLQDLFDKNRQYDQSIFKGQPLLLNVWATWCPTCHAEHKFLNELTNQGVKIIGMNYKDDRAKAIDWLNQAGDPYMTNLYDGDGMLGLDLGVYGAPETFMIDANGVIRYRHIGDVNAKNWQNKLLPMYRKLEQEAQQ